MQCHSCGKDLTDVEDTTTSNYSNYRVHAGELTGEIYFCDECECHTINDHLNGVVRPWSY
jgi:hypothetical protein